MNSVTVKPNAEQKGPVYCPICTHTVEATLAIGPKRRIKVKPGQRCAHCGSSLDAGFVMQIDRAA